MSKEFEIVIVGAGVTGLSVAALLAQSQNALDLRIRVVDAAGRPRWRADDDVALRVSAISCGSAELLQDVGAWSAIESSRLCPYDHMCVWDEADEPTSASSLQFDADEFAVRHLGYIVENILDAGHLLAGHRQAQERVASPGLTWLRDVAIAVQKANQGGLWLRVHHLLDIMADSGIDIPGIEAGTLEDSTAWLKATQVVGRKLGHVFRARDAITIDSYVIERRDVTDRQSRRRSEYAFFSSRDYRNISF